MFYDLTGSHTHDVHLLLRNVLSRWSNTHERTSMGAAERVTHCHLIPAGKQVFDSKLSIRKGGTVEHHELLKGCGAGRGTRSSMVDEIGCDQFICYRKVALIKQFFPGSTNNCFALLLCHKFPSFVCH